jgi:hypothetical protein
MNRFNRDSDFRSLSTANAYQSAWYRSTREVLKGLKLDILSASYNEGRF